MNQLRSTANRIITFSAARAFSSRMVTLRPRPRFDQPLAQHVFDVEHACLTRGG